MRISFAYRNSPEGKRELAIWNARDAARALDELCEHIDARVGKMVKDRLNYDETVEAKIALDKRMIAAAQAGREAIIYHRAAALAGIDPVELLRAVAKGAVDTSTLAKIRLFLERFDSP